jgi:DNA (cytosine-5)-methyltransferase 1
MRYGSVCSGIEAASVAWESLGWKASFLSEIEHFPRSVLAHHYPNTQLHGDFTTIQKDDYDPIELLVGGTPCQSFSVAGLRAGLDDPRGNLMLEFGSLARRLNPKWLVWENVPGVLSSNGGRDFGTFLGMLGELGYGFAYRVLDAQYFGVAQRRRRVFVVGCFGDWRSAAAVLFDTESLRGNPPPSREAGQEVAGTFKACAGKSGGWSNSVDHAAAGYMQPVIMSTGQAGAEIGIGIGIGIGTTLNCNHEAPIACYSLAGNTIGRKPENGGNGNGYDESGVSYTLTKTDQHAVAFSAKDSGRDAAIYHSLTLCNQHTGIAVASKNQVRRLTPTECEKLQGFPIGYTNIPGASDTGRYKALGNSMAVPVMKWIGERIQVVENINPVMANGRDMDNLDEPCELMIGVAE